MNQFDLTLEGQSNLGKTEGSEASRTMFSLPLAEADPRLKVLATDRWSRVRKRVEGKGE